MSQQTDSLAVALFSEIFTIDQLAHTRLTKALPKGMELSQFSVLNHLARLNEERTPAQLAQAFHLTRGAMTNTLNKLEWAGHVHIRPDWEDARRKFVSISPSGRAAREAAIAAVAPIIGDVVQEIGPERVRQALPILRELRERLGEI
ncbi:MarR family winged helix-turn-helix transcriptional regulator [Tropicimonas marinistellae]|uniref:MarR family winged helix-turn-helix transcriptional regulator n=1 Tax=Tropicimonas marinistellae TaxID=1739787 RepID=UPI0008375790|nr:MarR family transcriptional regulator [Tropicimonas marinistellae]